MKTFASLVEEVQKPGRCRRCGGCVDFCAAINYGALAPGPDGLPRFSDPEKCIECGLCYMLCPVVGALEEEARRRALWREPMGNVLGASVARAKDASIREIATDGGVLTAILLRLFDEGRIDGAVLAKGSGPFLRRPFLAATRKDILEAAASFAGPPHGRDLVGGRYGTFAAAVAALGEIMRLGLRRVACVGLPEQILTIRKMQVLGVVPTDSLYCLLGLFCSGHFEFGQSGRKRLERLGGFAWSEVERINVRDALHVSVRGRGTVTIPLYLRMDGFDTVPARMGVLVVNAHSPRRAEALEWIAATADGDASSALPLLTPVFDYDAMARKAYDELIEAQRVQHEKQEVIDRLTAERDSGDYPRYFPKAALDAYRQNAAPYLVFPRIPSVDRYALGEAYGRGKLDADGLIAALERAVAGQ